MDFLRYISTPITATEASPLITKLPLTKGRLIGGFLYFPDGPAGNLHFLARIGTHQILPYNTGENFRLNDCAVPFSLGIDLKDPKSVVDLVTWNDSLSLTHVLTVCFFLETHPSTL